MARAAARQIDVTRLPDDVVGLIDALGPGDELVITRNGEAIATIATAGVVDDAALGRHSEPSTLADGNVTVVATAMKLSASARKALSAELGAGYIVLDLHAAPTTADVLLVPPASPQLIGNVRALFPKARVIVTEIEDAELGVKYHGPIRRMLDAGAETYLAATAIPRLAKQLDHAVTRRGRLTGGATTPLEIDSPSGPSDGGGLADGELVVARVAAGGAGGPADGREVAGVGQGTDGGAEVRDLRGERVAGLWRRLRRGRRRPGEA